MCAGCRASEDDAATPRIAQPHGEAARVHAGTCANVGAAKRMAVDPVGLRHHCPTEITAFGSPSRGRLRTSPRALGALLGAASRCRIVLEQQLVVAAVDQRRPRSRTRRSPRARAVAGARRRTPCNSSRSSSSMSAWIFSIRQRNACPMLGNATFWKASFASNGQLRALFAVLVDQVIHPRGIFGQEMRDQHRLLEREVPVEHVLQPQRQRDQQRQPPRARRLGRASVAESVISSTRRRSRCWRRILRRALLASATGPPVTPPLPAAPARASRLGLASNA